MSGHGLPGLAVGVIENGKVACRRAEGELLERVGRDLQRPLQERTPVGAGRNHTGLFEGLHLPDAEGTPSPAAVPSISCISPLAPTGETALGLKPDSAWMTAAISSSSSASTCRTPRPCVTVSPTPFQ